MDARTEQTEGTTRMPAEGDIVGQYRIVEKLGEGGMGVVFSAKHRNMDRSVAIKLLRPELVSRPDVVRRFFEEARAINDIRSPHIIQVHDLVDDLDGDPPLAYMVIELLDGEDLERRLEREGAMAPEQVVELGCQVARALAAVHDSRRLHRDLKPENIFLVPDGEGIRVTLLDFGCVKALEGSDLDLTDPGTATGTPHYMAPEQITDQGVDERTDIYSLGVVLYRMLTNAVPLDAKSYGDLMLKLVMDRPAPINDRLPEGTSVPAALEAVVMRCLEKEPERRFQSMPEVEEALAHSLGTARPSPNNTAAGSIKTISPPEGSTVGPPGSIEAAPPPPHNATMVVPVISEPGRGRWLAVLAVLVLLTGGLIVWALVGEPGSPPRPSRQRRAAATPQDAGPAHRPPDRGAVAAPAQPDAAPVRSKQRTVARHRPRPRPRVDKPRPRADAGVVAVRAQPAPTKKNKPVPAARDAGRPGRDAMVKRTTNWIREPTFE